MTVVLLILGGVLGWTRTAQAEGPSTLEVQQAIGEYLASQNESAPDSKSAELRRRVRLKPAMASVIDGRIHVAPPP